MKTNREQKEAIDAIIENLYVDIDGETIEDEDREKAGAMIDVIINELGYEEVLDKYVFSVAPDSVRDSAQRAAEWNNNQISLGQLLLDIF